MTAPDPTAGERRMVDSLGNEHPADDLCDWAGCYPASPPAVAASTGTSEDVEALAEALRDVGIERGYVGADAIRKHWAERLLASDWLAAREAAARAEERERIAQAIEALPGPEGVGLSKWTHSKAVEGYLLAIEEAALAARIAREVRP